MNCFDGVTYFFFSTHWGTTLLPAVAVVGDGAFCAPADQSLRRGACIRMASPSIVPKGTSERKLRASPPDRDLGILKNRGEFTPQKKP